jgi:DNA-binding SARP family transcriptional activator/Tfp pilus assembly protein PilF
MLEFQLLGAPRIKNEGQEIQLPYQKATALLAYLVVSGRPYTRVTLTSLLWSEVNENRARNSLRSALSTIRREPAFKTILITERDTIYLNSDTFSVDVVQFKSAIRHNQTIDGLTEALNLWQGPFLEGFDLDGAPAFDDWLRTMRDQLDRLHQDGWLNLSYCFETAGRWAEAIEAAQFLLTLDPLREVGHRQLMRLYLKLQDRTAALRQYEQCRTLLAKELGVTPDARTQALHTQALIDPTSTHLLNEHASTEMGENLAHRIPFVGRRRELATLNRHFQEMVQARQGRLVLIDGEAGVGKTRLGQQWLVQIRNAQILTGRCFEAEHGVPYHPWIDILRASLSKIDWQSLEIPPLWLVELARLVPELRVNQPDLPEASTPEPGLVRGRLAEAVRQWIQALSQQQPVCLFLDDLQWIDRASLALLEYVLRHARDIPLLILGAQREVEIGPGWQRNQTLLMREGVCHRIALYRLSSADVNNMAHNIGFHTTDSQAFLKRLFRETEGNPLFVVEILRTLQGIDVDPAGDWPIPSTVQGVIQSRLDRLPGLARQLLAVASITGQAFDYQTLQKITGQPTDSILTALEEGTDAGLLQEQDGGYDFTHDKIRAVLYANLSTPRRRHLHARVAEALETLNANDLAPHLSILAHHFAAAGNLTRARNYALRAACRAVELYADEDALAEYERAAALSEDLGDDLPAQLAAEVRPFQPFGSETGPTVGVWPLIHSQRGLVYQRIGRYAEAEQEFRLALKHATQRSRPDEEALVHNLLSFLSYLRGNYDAVATHAQQAIEEAAQAGVGLRARSLQATGLKNLGIVAYQIGEYDRALDLYHQALEIFQVVGDKLGMGACYNNIGFLEDTRGNFDVAIVSFEKALDLRRELGQIEGQAVHLANIGRVYVHKGDVKQARTYLEQAFALSEEIKANWVLIKVYRTLSEAAILQGEWSTALENARRAEALAEELGSKEDLGGVLRLLAEIAAAWSESQLGDPAEYFKRSITLLKEVGESYELAQAQKRFEQYQHR